MSVHICGIGPCASHRLRGSALHRSGFGALFVYFLQVCETERFPPINIQHKLNVHKEGKGKTQSGRGKGREGDGGMEADLHSVRRQII